MLLGRSEHLADLSPMDELRKRGGREQEAWGIPGMEARESWCQGKRRRRPQGPQLQQGQRLSALVGNGKTLCRDRAGRGTAQGQVIDGYTAHRLPAEPVLRALGNPPAAPAFSKDLVSLPRISISTE